MGTNIELELKAHVADPEKCRLRLSETNGGGGAFSKDDAYWFSTEGAFSRSGLRVRQERCGENPAGRCQVTWKDKKIRNGIEINAEHEFELGKPDEGTVFEELLGNLGLEKRIRKHKKGWRWFCRAGAFSVTVELAEVGGLAGGRTKNLGWFLELEILLNKPGTADIEEARRLLPELLEQSGINKACIEERYYSEMLEEAIPLTPPA